MTLPGRRYESRDAVRELNDVCLSSRIRHQSCKHADFNERQRHRTRDESGRWSKISAVFFLLWAFSTLVVSGASPQVTLAWNLSRDVNVAGYRVHYGVVSRSYTNMISVGLSAKCTVSNLTEGTTYFFSVTAVDALGVESDFSNEVSFTVPFTPPSLRLVIPPTKQIVLLITGQRGHSYEVQASANLSTWSTVGIVTLNSGVTTSFTDSSATGQPARFYRLQELRLPRPPDRWCWESPGNLGTATKYKPPRISRLGAPSAQ